MPYPKLISASNWILLVKHTKKYIWLSLFYILQPLFFQVETWPARLSQVTPLTSPPLDKAATPPQHLLEWFLVSHITGFMRLLSLSELIIFSVSSPHQLTIFSKPDFVPNQYKVLKEMFDSLTFKILLRLTTKIKCQVKNHTDGLYRITLTMLSTVRIGHVVSNDSKDM